MGLGEMGLGKMGQNPSIYHRHTQAALTPAPVQDRVSVYGMGYSKHEFARIPMAAVNIDMSTLIP